MATDPVGFEYGFNSNHQFMLERKEQMKLRGLAFPDSADALACTFAVLVRVATLEDDDQHYDERERQAVLNYIPGGLR